MHVDKQFHQDYINYRPREWREIRDARMPKHQRQVRSLFRLDSWFLSGVLQDHRGSDVLRVEELDSLYGRLHRRPVSQARTQKCEDVGNRRLVDI